jgi:hypothetical protein
MEEKTAMKALRLRADCAVPPIEELSSVVILIADGPDDGVVRAAEVDVQTDDSSGAVRFSPHSMQKRAATMTDAPHCGQKRT